MKQKEQYTEEWELYEKGKEYNYSLDLYNKVASNERFYRGDQWEGINSNGLPKPTFNIFKRIINYYTSNLLSSSVSMRFSYASPFGSGNAISADEAAAFFEGGGCRHFDGGVLAAVHGFDGHGGVCAPFGADVDEVCPGQSAGFAPCAGSCEAEGGGAACEAQRLLRGFHAPGIEVGQAHDLRAGDVGVAFKGLHAACAEADEGYADQGDGGTGEWNGCGHGGNL